MKDIEIMKWEEEEGKRRNSTTEQAVAVHSAGVSCWRSILLSKG